MTSRTPAKTLLTITAWPEAAATLNPGLPVDVVPLERRHRFACRAAGPDGVTAPREIDVERVGQRLVVVSGAYGQAGSEYRTEIDSITKIVVQETTANGPAWFKAWTKAGLMMRDGLSAHARHAFVNSFTDLRMGYFLGAFSHPCGLVHHQSKMRVGYFKLASEAGLAD